MPKIIYLLLAATLFVVCGVRAQDSSKFAKNNFQYDAVSFRLPETTDSVRTDIYIAVPYSFLFFQNAVDKYVADYSVAIEVRDSASDSIVYSHTSDNSVLVPTVVMTKLRELDQSRADASQQRLHLAAGRAFAVHVAVKDITKHDHAAADFTIRTPQFSQNKIGMSGVLLYRSMVGNRMTPNIGQDASELTPSESGAFFELYNAPQSTPLWIVHTASDLSGDEVSRHVEVFVPDGASRDQVFTHIFDEGLWSGTYRFRTYVLSSASDTMLDEHGLETHALAMGKRLMQINGGHGIPLLNNNLDDAIAQLEIIAYGGAFDSLAGANTPAQKRKAIRDFWDKMNFYRDQVTTQPMEVFYRRLRYANAHFSQLSEGWRSDRGRIYIIYGEPTSNERSNYDATQKPYELWTYYDLNLRYYFVDQFLMNDYRLNGPMPPAGTFYWQREGNTN